VTVTLKVRFQPHCHQRAEGLADDGLPSGVSASVELLRSCGYEVEVLDTGCCGMAGTFGYEAEHYDLSMQVGELKLFPLLRTPSQPPPPNPKEGISDLGDMDNKNGFGGGAR
jgi:Fe-S oxidoreductase